LDQFDFAASPLKFSGWTFAMDDTRTACDPLDATSIDNAAVTEGVFVMNTPAVDKRYWFESAMRMWVDTLDITSRIKLLGSGMMQQNERIKIPKCMHGKGLSNAQRPYTCKK
jgi:hypothetical protein